MKSNDPYTRLKKRIDSYIANYPLPNREINNKRFKKLRLLKDDPTKIHEYKKIRDVIIISNGGFGMKYAILYCRKINDSSVIEDMFQQAQIGIIEAVDLFDPEYGVNFTTFAYHYVRKCIIEFIKENKLVKVPKSMARNIKNVKEVYNQLYSENSGKDPSALEIKKHLNKTKQIDLKEEMIKDIVILNELNSSASDETFIIGTVNDISDKHNKHETLVLLRSMTINELTKFSPELIDTICMRFGIMYERPFSIPEICLIRGLNDRKIEMYKDKTKVFLNSRQ